ncbi:DUF6603 domain-containing protein [Streptomyces sp. NPDC059590]|uniref:DUF6603 domain-containing protein n=1 Tax=Streptomyces sp. NPDC059590 TaxID=3346877 RepID=UPI00369BEA3F
MTGLSREDLLNCLDQSTDTFALSGSRLDIPAAQELFQNHLKGSLGTNPGAGFQGNPETDDTVVLAGKLRLPGARWDGQRVKARFPMADGEVAGVEVEISLPRDLKDINSGGLHLDIGFLPNLGFTEMQLLLETRTDGRALAPFAGVAAELTFGQNIHLRMASAGKVAAKDGNHARRALPSPDSTSPDALSTAVFVTPFDVSMDGQGEVTVGNLLKAFKISSGGIPAGALAPKLTEVWVVYDPQSDVLTLCGQSTDGNWRFSLGSVKAHVPGGEDFIYIVESACGIGMPWSFSKLIDMTPARGMTLNHLGAGVCTGTFEAEQLNALNESIGEIEKQVAARLPIFPDKYFEGDGSWFAMAEYEKEDVPTTMALPQILGAGVEPVWFDVSEQLGPLYLGRIGLDYDDPNVWVLVDGSVGGSLKGAGVRLELAGAKVGIPLNAPDFPLPLIEGLGLDVQLPDFRIAGGLIFKKDSHFYYLVEGDVILQFGNPQGSDVTGFQLMGALGKTKDPEYTTGFLFGRVNAGTGRGIPIGPVIIDGFCIGFGYNNQLRTPGPTEVLSFPLMVKSTHPVDKNPTEEDAEPNPPDGPLSALRALSATNPPWIRPQGGAFWGVLGVSASICGQVDAQAVVAVAIDKIGWSAALIGLAAFEVPSSSQSFAMLGGWDPFVRIQLVLDATYQSATGLFAIAAAIDAKAFFFANEARITGALALNIWLTGGHRGQFVLTAGGYPHGITMPSYYPSNLDRVKVGWTLSKTVSMTASVYCTLTPAAYMFGCKMELDAKADFKIGHVILFCTAGFDALIQWHPFHVRARIGLSVGVEIKLVFTKRFECELTLDAWAPPFGGNVIINLPFSIRWAIPIGQEERTKPAWASWEHVTAMLPAAEDRLHATAGDGLLPSGSDTESSPQDAGSRPPWAVSTHGFSFTTHCAVPATSACVNGVTLSDSAVAPTLSIRPMGPEAGKGNQATHSVTIARGDTQIDWQGQGWRVECLTEQVTSALWGTPVDGEPDPKEPALTEDTYITGIRVAVPDSTLKGGLPPVGSSVLEETEPLSPDGCVPPVAGPHIQQPAPAVDQRAITDIATDLGSNSTAAARSNLYNALDSLGYGPHTNDSLSDYQDRLESGLYNSQPLVLSP